VLTIVTPALSTRLTTPRIACQELGLPMAGEELDRVTRLVDRASALISGCCRRPFGLATYAETLSPRRRHFGEIVRIRPYFLSRYPVIGATSVADGAISIDDTLFQVDGEMGSISFSHSVWLRSGVVQYRAGYVLPEDANVPTGASRLPGDVEAACLETVKSLYFSGGPEARDPRIRSDSTEGVGATSYFDPKDGESLLPTTVAGVLGEYTMRRR
jgi:hypothetical protein